MSNGSPALALSLGAGAGLLLWFVLRDREPAPTAPPSGPLAMRLDATGIAIGTERIDVATAVARAKAAGGAELTYDTNAPASIYVDLAAALSAARVPFSSRKAG